MEGDGIQGGLKKMKKLGFGCMRLPRLDKDDSKSIDIEQFKKMVDTFLERGFTYFDTAYMYHGYQSEIAVREALVKRYPRDSYTVTTKLPTMMLKSAEDMERIFNEQLEKTGLEYFDYYWLHNINRSDIAQADGFDAWKFVIDKKAEGKVKHIGFSFHDMPDMLDDILTKHPEMEFVQLQLNYLDWDAENVRSRENYEVCVKHGKKVVVMEPVKGGTLANVPEDAEKLFKEIRPDRSVPSWGIRFAASLENVFMVLSGMSNYEQLLDNTSYMGSFEPLNGKEREAVRKAVDIIHSAITVNCTGCGYCTEGCPKHIPIPEYFRLYNGFKQLGGGWTAPQVKEYAEISSRPGVGKADDCIRCGRCEKTCPQHLMVRWLLPKVADELDVL